jgi:uncharacterized protein YyaL (SSP411 family)
VLTSCSEDFENTAEIIPLLNGRQPDNGKTRGYVCEAYTCQVPAETAAQLTAQLTAQVTSNRSTAKT